MLSLKDWHGSPVSIAAEIEEVGVSLLVLNPYTALYIKLVCMAVTPGGSLFWRRYTRKPPNSLLKTCQQSTWITGTMLYGLMRWKLICLLQMASGMWGSNQVRSTKIRVSCLLSSMVVGMSWSKAAWVLQVLESYISLRETWTPTYTVKYCCRAWSSPSRNWVTALFQHDNDSKHTSKMTIALLKRLRVKLAKHISWLEPNRTFWGDSQAEGGGMQSLKYLPAPRHHLGGVEEHSSGYLWSSSKLHAQEIKGSYG